MTNPILTTNNKLICLIDKLLSLLIIFLYFNCIFDPAALFFHLKTPTYIIILLLYTLRGFLLGEILVSRGLLVYVIIFAFIIPMLSLLFVLFFYFGKNNNIEVMGLAFKTSMFLSLAIIFYAINNSHFKSLAYLLSLLSLTILIVNKYTWLGYSSELNEFGQKYKIFALAPAYIFDQYIVRIYFWASPMLLFAIGYFSYQFINIKHSFHNLGFLVLNITGMFLSGSRVNIAVSVFAFFVILFFYVNKTKKVVFATIFITCLIGLVLYNTKKIAFFFGTESDTIKFSMIQDYMNIYKSDIRHLIFGQGIGSQVYFPSRGQLMYYTELTYLDLFRKYGIFLGLIYFILMIFPCLYLFRVSKEKRWLVIVYLIYFLMSFFNPFYFSSNGIIILSIILYEIYEKTDGKVFRFSLKLNI